MHRLGHPDAWPLPTTTWRSAGRAAGDVSAALLGFADRIQRTLLPSAPERDGVGRDRYAVESRYLAGIDLDLEETYAWVWDELARIVAEKEAVAEQSAPGRGVAGAVAVLDADPARLVRGRDALQTWLQVTADRAVAALDGVHFDIPEPVRRIEGRLTPTYGEGVYYSPPSADFSRPGRMWWSLPDGVTDMTTWRETTTVFREEAPGHHLQIGQPVADAATGWACSTPSSCARPGWCWTSASTSTCRSRPAAGARPPLTARVPQVRGRPAREPVPIAAHG